MFRMRLFMVTVVAVLLMVPGSQAVLDEYVMQAEIPGLAGESTTIRSYLQYPDSPIGSEDEFHAALSVQSNNDAIIIEIQLVDIHGGCVMIEEEILNGIDSSESIAYLIDMNGADNCSGHFQVYANTTTDPVSAFQITGNVNSRFNGGVQPGLVTPFAERYGVTALEMALPILLSLLALFFWHRSEDPLVQTTAGLLVVAWGALLLPLQNSTSALVGWTAAALMMLGAYLVVRTWLDRLNKEVID